MMRSIEFDSLYWRYKILIEDVFIQAVLPKSIYVRTRHLCSDRLGARVHMLPSTPRDLKFSVCIRYQMSWLLHRTLHIRDLPSL